MAEKEYIEREAVNRVLDEPTVNYSICSALQAIPAADVAPVKHGRWISEDSKIFKCSECDYGFEHEGYMQFFNFCPNCGAKMDG
ncbi:MAG: hypothetical protein ACI4Q6_06725, partial [Huintestinicola sp.]